MKADSVRSCSQALLYLTEALLHQAEYNHKAKQLEARTHALMAAQQGMDWLEAVDAEIPRSSLVHKAIKAGTAHNWIKKV